ncbi:hypothetical protein XELAEV_18001229mg [Xenopus laevis]|nr:hypothetical protein XELAEV_18001229mg [Xenopus laevis]
MWQSVLHHSINEHTWRGAMIYKKCSHANLTCDQVNGTDWLIKDSPSYAKLHGVVNNPQLLKDLPQLIHYCHTGALESYHSVMLKYRSKSIHFILNGSLYRSCHYIP